MRIDLTTKIILALIAAGLWANAAPRLIEPAMATGTIVDGNGALVSIANGDCNNPFLCPYTR